MASQVAGAAGTGNGRPGSLTVRFRSSMPTLARLRISVLEAAWSRASSSASRSCGRVSLLVHLRSERWVPALSPSR